MKKVLLISLAIMMVAGSAMADHIGIYTDQVGTLDACTIVPPQFAPFSLYVVHKLSTASTGSEFMITDPNLTGWSYSGSSVLNGFLSIGSATTGLALAYGGCVAGPAISCVAINMFGFSATGATCGRIDVVPSPTAGGIIKIVDCEYIEFPATGGTAYVNPNGTCSDCNEPGPVATEESTWGKVKSLYR